MSILILKKIQLRAVFLEKTVFFLRKKIKFPFKRKKHSLYRNSKKDSRKSVLNQTHIVGHGKSEKTDFRHEYIFGEKDASDAASAKNAERPCVKVNRYPYQA